MIVYHYYITADRPDC